MTGASDEWTDELGDSAGRESGALVTGASEGGTDELGDSADRESGAMVTGASGVGRDGLARLWMAGLSVEHPSVRDTSVEKIGSTPPSLSHNARRKKAHNVGGRAFS